MRPPLSFTYLSDADIQACAIASKQVALAVHAAFESLGRGRCALAPQLLLPVDDSLDFKAKGGVLPEQGIAAVKWYGFAKDNPDLGLPNFMPLVVLNELPTGRPLAVMDGHWISGVRTAAISVVAARVLADAQSRSVGFVGAGLQAVSHLDALLDFFPLRRMVAHTRSQGSASDLISRARACGIEARWSADPREAVAGHDIVVSCIPRMTDRAGFLDASWLADRCFVALVDAGRAWNGPSLRAIDRAYTDHLDADGRPLEALFYERPFAGQLSELVGLGPEAPRASGRQAIVFGGSGLADTAVAALVYREARSRGLGTTLPL